ncbi:MAG: RNA polymerase sigma factor [Xanthomonadales bacterium]|nr:RNA polymerase sigma factor [Xanthomonadales bacterium]
MNREEQKLVERAAKGDRLAFRSLVLDNSAAMFRLAFRFTCDAHAAEDVVQEAFIKAFQKLSGFNLDASFSTWMHRITVNTAMDYLRREQTRDRYEQEAAECQPDRIDERPDRETDISRETLAAMADLTDLERAALTLRHFEGHSIAEIAETLDLTTNACKQAIFRAVKKMRAALKPLVTT